MSDLIPKEELKKLHANEKAEYLLKLTALRKKVNDEYDKVRAELLETTRNLGIEQLKTANYTITRAKRTTIDIYNHEAVGEELEKLGYMVKYQKKISDLSLPTVKAVAQNQKLLGVDTRETEYIIVRAREEK